MTTTIQKAELHQWLGATMRSWAQVETRRKELEEAERVDKEMLQHLLNAITPFLPQGPFMRYPGGKWYRASNDSVSITRSSGKISLFIPVMAWDHYHGRWESLSSRLTIELEDLPKLILIKTEPHELSDPENRQYWEFPPVPGLGTEPK